MISTFLDATIAWLAFSCVAAGLYLIWIMWGRNDEGE